MRIDARGQQLTLKNKKISKPKKTADLELFEFFFSILLINSVIASI